MIRRWAKKCNLRAATLQPVENIYTTRQSSQNPALVPSDNVVKLARTLPAVVTWVSTINELLDRTKAVVLEMSA
jgi:hypothetical protein